MQGGGGHLVAWLEDGVRPQRNMKFGRNGAVRVHEVAVRMHKTLFPIISVESNN
jgi:hypothetical protein